MWTWTWTHVDVDTIDGSLSAQRTPEPSVSSSALCVWTKAVAAATYYAPCQFTHPRHTCCFALLCCVGSKQRTSLNEDTNMWEADTPQLSASNPNCRCMMCFFSFHNSRLAEPSLCKATAQRTQVEAAHGIRVVRNPNVTNTATVPKRTNTSPPLSGTHT